MAEALEARTVRAFFCSSSPAGGASRHLAHAGGAKPVEEPTLTDPTNATTPAPSTTPAPTPTPTTTPAPEIVYSAEQQADIDRKIADARRRAESEAKRAITDAATAAQASAAEAARLKAEEDKGAYDAAKAIIEQERDAAKAEAQAHQERLTTALETIKPGVETRWTDLPDEVKALFDGADDDVLAKAAHLAKTEPLVAKLAGSNGPRPPASPRPGAPVPPTDDEARRAQVRSYRDF